LVRAEIQHLTTLEPTDLETRYWCAPTSGASPPAGVGLATQRSSIDRVMDCCRQVGLRCQCVDTGATALARLGLMLRPASNDEVWSILDLGEQQLRLAVCVDDTPVVVRALPTGGNAWTELIAKELEVTPKSAEVQKCEHGIAPPASHSIADPNDAAHELSHMLLKALKPALTNLAAEIKRVYEYVLSCYPDRQAGDLILTGGSARLTHLPEHLAESLGIPVRRVSDYVETPGSRLQYHARQHDTLEYFGLAIGLAAEE
jgi:type IV pilus assembly protein PilM